MGQTEKHQVNGKTETNRTSYRSLLRTTIRTEIVTLSGTLLTKQVGREIDLESIWETEPPASGNH
jgi:hypothetical protein